jgi:UDP:flavonoid glycosyltransferase YjiC (YdhE family)
MTVLKEKPIIVTAAFPAAGHTAGVMRISEHLIEKGHEVYFITRADFKASTDKIGAHFVENAWPWEEVFAARPPDFDEVWNFKNVFANSTPLAHRALKDTLEMVRKNHPEREVIILHESFSGGLGPFLHGAPLPDGYTVLPKIINFHTSVYLPNDLDFPPFGPGLPYDPTPENLALWRSVIDAMKPGMDGLNEHYNTVYKSVGATQPMTTPIFSVAMDMGDVTVLATAPSLEYPVRNPKLRFIGGLPLKPLGPNFVPPSWWPTLTSNAALPANSPDKKKVVFVSQGTVHRNPTELLLPTINGLAAREDLLVIATLGVRGAELDDAARAALPANAIVVDYLAYDAVLPLTDVFVSNAGYGGFMHGVMNGVPMVLAGTVADKAEVCARAEWAGIAVNLRAQEPAPDAIRAAVDKVLADSRFKETVVKLQKENQELDAFAKIDEILEELTGGR